MRISDWSSDVCSSDLKWLGPVEISAVPIPHDCTDGFLYAYWRRPAAYLAPRIRAAMSSFWMLDNVRSEERRVGKGCFRTCRSRGSTSPSIKKTYKVRVQILITITNETTPHSKQ